MSTGDRRSIGRSNRVVAAVLQKPQMLRVLFRGVLGVDPLLRMRCADAIEKVTAERRELLAPFKKLVLGKLAKIEQADVRWHVAPMLGRLHLSEREANKVLEILLGYTNDRSSIVKTMSMQAMADLAIRSSRLRQDIAQHINELTVIGTPAMKARGRMIQKRLTRLAG